MKIVSIDVGIKNLALCIIESIDNIEPTFKIIYWNCINLSESKKICTCYTLTKKTKKPCSSPAFFLRMTTFFVKLMLKNRTIYYQKASQSINHLK